MRNSRSFALVMCLTALLAGTPGGSAVTAQSSAAAAQQPAAKAPAPVTTAKGAPPKPVASKRAAPSRTSARATPAAHAARSPRLTLGEFLIDPPTLINLGFEWFIEGDDNRNASVAVSYRKQGAVGWHPGLPLLRVHQQPFLLALQLHQLQQQRLQHHLPTIVI